MPPKAAAYWDAALHERELERIFARAWLFVGHESLVPEPGSYVTNFMGDDPVIVCRDKAGALRVLLNKCRHRGNKVCLYDAGTAKAFRCGYHGWTYGLSGELAAVPLDTLYDGTLRREDWGLAAAPKVASYKGFVFASWDTDAVPLEEFLGADLLWYLDRLFFDDPGGLEVLPGRHRYVVPVNWKLLAENFGGDMYHFASTHASINVLTRKMPSDPIRNNTVAGTRYYSVDFGGETPPHGLLQVAVGEAAHEADLAQAQAYSADARAWVQARIARRNAATAECAVKPASFHIGNIWPNLSLIGMGPALSGRTLLQLHPRGPELTELWQWCLVERSAPADAKAQMVFAASQRQAAAGMVAPDDADNFQRIHDVLHTNAGKRLDFNYDLALDADGASLFPDLPGRVRPQITETYHRLFYRYWAAAMQDA